MQLKLYSRTTEVGGRQVKVHEMTEGEVTYVKLAAFWVGFLCGAAPGLAAVILLVLYHAN